MISRNSLLGLLVAFLMFSCGPAEEIENSVSEAKIVGGERVEIGGWRSTVALTHARGGAFCSGVAYNRNLVITAAHCVKGKKEEDIRVHAGAGEFFNNYVGKYRVSIAEMHPRFKGSDNDIAYLLLKDPLPYDLMSSYVPFLSDSLEIKELTKIGKLLTLVGFGTRDSDYAGEKWQVEAAVIASAPGTTFNKKSEFAVGGYGRDSCQGDSGGPAYGKLRDGSWRVVGITSRGVGCGDGGVYTFLHPHLCWIEEASHVSLRLPEGYCF